MNSPNQKILFESLELKGTSWTRWVSSMLLHIAVVAIIIAIPVSVRQAMKTPPAPREPYVISLVTPPPPPPPQPKIIPAPRPTVQPPPAPPKKVAFKAPEPPRIERPQAAVKILPTVEAPKIPDTPKVAPRIDAPKMEVPAPRPVVQTGDFAAVAPAAATPTASARSVKTGGFGNPDGAKSSTLVARNEPAPALGAFDMSSGSSRGAGRESAGSNGPGGKQIALGGFGASAPSAGNGTGEKQIAVGGFGASAPSGGNGSASQGRGEVQNSGFGQYQSAPPPRSAKIAAPEETPVEITYKPKPGYTPEAVAKKVEGEVLLEVVFAADGQIQVLRLQRGLGYGLDEKARIAASQIKFHPGTRGGSPVDVRGVVHIVFELS